LRLAELYPLANLDEALIQYRRHDNQITRSTNWKQKFARDLATLSSRYRRAGKTDPITNADEPIDLARPPDHYQVEIQNLIAAYQVLSNQLDSNTVSTDKIEKVLSAINNGLIGRSSKPQASAAAHAAKLAWKNSRYGLATGALIKGLRLNPVAFAIALTT
jgi:hypothetical protein